MRTILLLLLLTCCYPKEQKQVKIFTHEKIPGRELHKEQSYDEIKTKSATLLQHFQQTHQKQEEAQIIRFIADTLIAYWYGTKWNFYGTTQVPGEGSIACGYFVTTVLRDAGLKINRIKLAQCASETMIIQLSYRTSIQRFSNEPIESFIQKAIQNKPGLYIVGLDCHTGFLYNDGKETYFIHSSYVPPKMVVKEKAKESVILAASKYRIVGKVKI